MSQQLHPYMQHIIKRRNENLGLSAIVDAALFGMLWGLFGLPTAALIILCVWRASLLLQRIKL